MIFTKKGLAVAAAALALSASAAFAEVTFTNTVSTGIVEITSLGNKANVEFAGISERIEAEYTSDKFNFGAVGELTFDNEPGAQYVYSDATEFTEFFDLKWTDLDFYLEFSPWNFLTIFLSDDIYTPGSYLPVVGFSMGSGNLGSDFGVMVTPINGLRITAGLDVISYFGGKSTDLDVWTDDPITTTLPKVNIGADYTYKNMWSVGLVARNILNWNPVKAASIGLFGSFTGIEGWAFYTGVMFNHNYDWYWDVNDQYPNANIVGFIDEYRVEGLILFDLGLSCWNDKISVDFDLSTNFGADRAYDWDSRYQSLGGTKSFDDANNTNVAKQYKHMYDKFDLYTGLRGKYQFTKAFSTDITLKGVGDFNPRVSRVEEETDGDGTTYVGKNTNVVADKFDGRGVIFEAIPTVAYTVGRHTFGFGVDLVFTDPYVTISFPTTWTYRF